MLSAGGDKYETDGLCVEIQIKIYFIIIICKITYNMFIFNYNK